MFLCRSKVSLGLFAGQNILVLNHFTLNSVVLFFYDHLTHYGAFAELNMFVHEARRSS